MLFLDEVKIFLKGGNGGDGVVGFHRAKYIPEGGPDGGNGGNGGNIVFVAVDNLNTLIDLKFKKKIIGNNGENGGSACRTGKNGKDIRILVPIGTQIFDENGNNLLFDLDYSGKECILVHGGCGGSGNKVFKSSTNQTPREFTYGEDGESGYFVLKLKLIADIGLVGFPNVGKSTLITKISNAKSKVADYAFTTVTPVLGFVEVDRFDGFVVADIPGLIDGASDGFGLGHKFLKHIERCKAILHLVDPTAENDLINNYNLIRNELEKYSKVLFEKNEFVAITKAETIDKKNIEKMKKKLEKHLGKKIYIISSYTGAGIKELMFDMYKAINN